MACRKPLFRVAFRDVYKRQGPFFLYLLLKRRGTFPCLNFEHVSAGYGKKEVLKDLSLHFEEGRITTVIGPNGRGKSTLVQCINGQVLLTAGRIIILDELTTFMDISYQSRFLQLVRKLKDQGKTILLFLSSRSILSGKCSPGRGK